MSFLSILYTIIFKPLQMFLEWVYVIADQFVASPVIAIVALSLVMNLLVLPLYRRADAMQEAQRQLEKKMAPDLAFLKKTFKGDEKVMMMQTYYRQHNYKPIYALKGSLSLALEIPFFVAAYQFLSHLTLLEGVSCGPIADLGAPDAMLTLFGISINLLPVLMTAINFVSSYLYAKGYPAKTKIQLYGIALIFLVLLYNSPAGLVFYWTLNNLFSLAKNIFYRLIKNPKKVLKWLVAVCGTAICGYVVVTGMVKGIRQFTFFALLFVVCWVPAFSGVLSRFFGKFSKPVERLKFSVMDAKATKAMFWLGSALLVFFLGAYIPTTVISASPLEFVRVNYGPLTLIFHTLFLYIGLFLWVFIFYSLSDEKGRKIYSYALWVIAGVSLLNFFISSDYGLVSSSLVIEYGMDIPHMEQLVNLVFVCFIGLVLLLFLLKFPRIVRTLCSVLIVAVLAISVYNVVGIVKTVGENKQEDTDDYITADEITPILSLSTEQENVIVFMLDRAVGRFFPYIMNEKPELLESFDGFVWYPNTLTYGHDTNFASPALFGGYEYTPEEMNKRDTELLVTKHNEAISVLPVLFMNEGFDVTVCDVPYGNYSWTSDLTIYDQYEGIETHHTIGHYEGSYAREFGLDTEVVQKSNFFFYSILRSIPKFLQEPLYRGGQYGSALWNSNINSVYLDGYGVLENLNAMTEFTDGDGSFLMMQNDATHSNMILSVPDYSVDKNASLESAVEYYRENHLCKVDGSFMKMDNEIQIGHYQVNVSSYMALAEWFDYLKENGAYDNTRIIVVSDHGYNMKQFDDMLFDRHMDIEIFNSLLLVKDFNSHGEPQQDDAFMMIADVPTLATQGVIDDPVNPFTGKAINSDTKTSQPQYLTTSERWDVTSNNGYKFDTSDGRWYAVTAGDILDRSNWTLVDEPN